MKRSGRARALETAFRALSTGIALLDARRTVLFTNDAMAELPVDAMVVGREVRARVATEDRILQRLIRAACDGPEGRGGHLLVKGAGDLALGVRVVALPRTHDGEGDAAALVAVVGAAPPPVDRRMLIEMWGFTPAEARLAAALMRGEALSAYAAERGLGMSTVRTHAARLREKTGCRSLTEVVALLASFASPVVSPYGVTLRRPARVGR